MGLKQDDMDILERKFSIYIILLVEKHPGLTKTELIRFEKGNEKTKFNRISELTDAGILEYTKIDEQTIKKVYLTDAGSKLAEKMKKARLLVLNLKKTI